MVICGDDNEFPQFIARILRIGCNIILDLKRFISWVEIAETIWESE